VHACYTRNHDQQIDNVNGKIHAGVCMLMYKRTLTLRFRVQVLRKKYYNQIEDMKGKIRVYARCRPFAKYEKDKNCQQAVTFLDDVSCKVEHAQWAISTSCYAYAFALPTHVHRLQAFKYTCMCTACKHPEMYNLLAGQAGHSSIAWLVKLPPDARGALQIDVGKKGIKEFTFDEVRSILQHAVMPG
jgi:hypothetical protein